MFYMWLNLIRAMYFHFLALIYFIRFVTWFFLSDQKFIFIISFWYWRRLFHPLMLRACRGQALETKHPPLWVGPPWTHPETRLLQFCQQICRCSKFLSSTWRCESQQSFRCSGEKTSSPLTFPRKVTTHRNAQEVFVFPILYRRLFHGLLFYYCTD